MSWYYGKRGRRTSMGAGQQNRPVQCENESEQCGMAEMVDIGENIAPSYGAAYLDGGADISIQLPASAAYVPFDDAARLSGGVAQTDDGLIVADAGDYEITFTLCFTASAAAFATFMLQADKQSVPGGTFRRAATKEQQAVSGSTIAALGCGAHVRIAVTSATVLGLTLSGAYLSVKRLG